MSLFRQYLEMASDDFKKTSSEIKTITDLKNFAQENKILKKSSSGYTIALFRLNTLLEDNGITSSEQETLELVKNLEDKNYTLEIQKGFILIHKIIKEKTPKLPKEKIQRDEVYLVSNGDKYRIVSLPNDYFGLELKKSGESEWQSYPGKMKNRDGVIEYLKREMRQEKLKIKKVME